MPDQPTTESPQPWHCDHKLGRHRRIMDADDKVIGWLNFGDQAEANADLIIAAGPMRELLRELIAELGMWMTTDHDDMMLSLIERAEELLNS